MGGYPQSGDGGYDAPGSLFRGQSGGNQPAEQFPAAQGGYGGPAPQGDQQAEYPSLGGYEEGGPPRRRAALPWIIGGLVLLLAAGGVGLFFLLKDDSPTPVAERSSTTTSAAEQPSEEQPSEETSAETSPQESTGTATPEVGPPPPAGGPAPIGSGDSSVDGLAEGCFSGDMQACDDLYRATAGPDLEDPDPTPTLQPFFDYAFTCGDRLTEAEVEQRFCVRIWPDA